MSGVFVLRFAGAEGVSHASTCASQGNAQFRCERRVAIRDEVAGRDR